MTTNRLLSWIAARRRQPEEEGARIFQLSDYADRRGPGPDDPHTCPCGSLWFRPWGVVFERDGQILGWAAPAICIECDTPMLSGGADG